MPNRIKYPRTLHLPWSLGRSRDDLILTSTSTFEGEPVVITEKRDGENTTIYSDGIHARSMNSSYHESRSWVNQLQARIGHELPNGWRVCGENLYAQHSIPYFLNTYLEVFSIWDETNTALSWTATEEWSDLLGLTTVPVLYAGIWPGRDFLDNLWAQCDHSKVEGYVVRVAGRVPFAEFSTSIAKFVRPNHVTTAQHWKRNWKPNKLL